MTTISVSFSKLKISQFKVSVLVGNNWDINCHIKILFLGPTIKRGIRFTNMVKDVKNTTLLIYQQMQQI